MSNKKSNPQPDFCSFPRPPVVTVMGHIDHGKTTLLDKIRSKKVANKEAGGITQKIGAYQIEFTPKGSKGKEKITFIDTPGHAAFSQMRARGAMATDLVVLVIAADEGVKPQTKECLDHIKKADIPFIVAINKIDLPGALPDKVKGELAEAGAPVEGFGGQVPVVSLSAKTGKGVDDLLEMIILMAKMMDLKANKKDQFAGVVLESFSDKEKGILATVLIQKGELNAGDKIYSGQKEAKVKAMFDENGLPVAKAAVSAPAQVMGFKFIPPVGSFLKSEPFAAGDKPAVDEGESDDPFASLFAEGESEEKKEGELPIIIKADSQGSLEAMVANLPEEVKIIHQGVGEVIEADVFLAQPRQTQIFAFGVGVSASARRLADNAGVAIRSYEVIYDFFEELEGQVLKLMEPTIDRRVLGKAEILKKFPFGDKGQIAGCRVAEGEMNKNSEIHLVRKNKDLGIVKISSMKHGKEEINKASFKDEFGIIFANNVDFEVGDVLISFKQNK